VPPSTKRRPSHPAKEWGGPLRSQDVVTLSSPTQKGNPEGLPQNRRHRDRRRTTYRSSASLTLNRWGYFLVLTGVFGVLVVGLSRWS
jgi:hypothetical protein